MAIRGIQASNVSPHGVALPVVRDKNDLRVTLEVEHIPAAANLMAADCATARIIRGQPTFLIGQLHPLRDTRLMRLLAVRYPRDQFIRRSVSNEKFRKESAELSAKAFPEWKV